MVNDLFIMIVLKKIYFMKMHLCLADWNTNGTQKNATTFDFKITEGCCLIEFWFTEKDNYTTNSLDVVDFQITLNGMSEWLIIIIIFKLLFQMVMIIIVAQIIFALIMTH